MSIRIITNNTPRPILSGFELTKKERKEFDYIDWNKVNSGEADPEFFRYKGNVYSTDEFMSIEERDRPLFFDWHGYKAETFFSGILIKLVGDDYVVVGRYYA